MSTIRRFSIPAMLVLGLFIVAACVKQQPDTMAAPTNYPGATVDQNISLDQVQPQFVPIASLTTIRHTDSTMKWGSATSVREAKTESVPAKDTGPILSGPVYPMTAPEDPAEVLQNGLKLEKESQGVSAAMSATVSVDDDDEDEDEDEMEFHGVVAAISDVRLVLEDGTTFLINGDTEFEDDIKVGDRVEVGVILVAIEVELDDSGEEDDEDDDGDDDEDDEGAVEPPDVTGPTFSGAITSLSDTRLGLGRLFTFVLNDETFVSPGAEVGNDVEVSFEITRGLLVARSVVVTGGTSTSEADDDSDDLEDGHGVDEDGELEIVGVVKSFSDIEIVLEDGTTFVVNDETEFETTLRVGLKVEIEAERIGGELIALEVDR